MKINKVLVSSPKHAFAKLGWVKGLVWSFLSFLLVTAIAWLNSPETATEFAGNTWLIVPANGILVFLKNYIEDLRAK